MFAVSTRSSGPGSPSGDVGPPSARGAIVTASTIATSPATSAAPRWRSSTAIATTATAAAAANGV